jgi:hypothetical protein
LKGTWAGGGDASRGGGAGDLARGDCTHHEEKSHKTRLRAWQNGGRGGGEGGGGRPRPCLHCDGCEREYRTLLVSMRQDLMALLCFFFGLRRQLAAAGSSKRLAAAAQAMRTLLHSHKARTGGTTDACNTPLHSNVSFVVVHTSGVVHVWKRGGHHPPPTPLGPSLFSSDRHSLLLQGSSPLSHHRPE